MLILKIMGLEDAPDHDDRKTRDVITGITRVTFCRDTSGAYANVLYAPTHPGWKAETECLRIPANAYVMTEAGKTIDSFSASPPPGHDWVKVNGDVRPFSPGDYTWPGLCRVLEISIDSNVWHSVSPALEPKWFPHGDLVGPIVSIENGELFIVTPAFNDASPKTA